MTPNSDACSSRRTRKPLRASASATAAPPRPPPTTRIGSRVLANIPPVSNRKTDRLLAAKNKQHMITGNSMRCRSKWYAFYGPDKEQGREDNVAKNNAEGPGRR